MIVFEGRALKLGKIIHYQSDGWSIMATFINDKCERIRYRKTGSWTDEQVYAILKANSNGQTWTRSQPFGKSQKTWIGFGESSAHWTSYSGMDITTDVYYAMAERLKKEAVKKSKAVPNF